MRDEKIMALRPDIDLEIKGEKNAGEQFMHSTLRPVLKFQHEAILTLIQSSSHFEKLKLASFPREERREKLKQFVSKNAILKNQLIGVVIGIFISEEILFYTQNSTEINKRIIDMCVTRYDSTSLY